MAGGLQPLSILVAPDWAAGGATALEPGAVLSGVTQQTPAGVVLNVAGFRVPLPAQAQLPPGLLVSVEVLRGDGGLQLRLTPAASPSHNASAPSVAGSGPAAQFTNATAPPAPPVLVVSLPPGRADGPAAPLVPGRVYTAVVQGKPGALSLDLGGVRVPLSAQGPLTPGLPVSVEVVRADAGLQLRVTAQPAPQQTGAPAPSPPAAAQPVVVPSPPGAVILSGGALQPGATLAATLRGTPQHPVLDIAGARVPLDTQVALPPGTAVSVEVLQSGSTLRLTPESAPAAPQAAPAAAGAPPPAPPTVLVSVPRDFAAQTGVALRPGSVYTAVVEGKPGSLFLNLAGTRLPLGAELAPGQPVRVEVARSDSGLELRITPQPAAPPPAPATSTAPSVGAATLADAIVAALRVLGAFDRADSAASLTPAWLPATPAAVRSLLSLFVGRESLSRDLATLQTLVDQAGASGALSREAAEEVTAALSRYSLKDSAGLRETLARWGGGAGRSLEARMAAAIASGRLDTLLETVADDLRGVFARLREDPALARFLRQTGQTAAFRSAADRVLDRLTGANLQNLRGLEFPYAFLDLPGAPDSPFERVQVHLFGEGGRERRFDAKNATVVMDLSMSALGDLWIVVSIMEGRCSCRFQVSRPDVADAILAERDALRGALADAGYASAQVQAGVWSSDRIEETAALMRRLSGLNVRA